MPKFGSRSRANLKYVHPLLIDILDEAIKRVDFTVICGYRKKHDQIYAYEHGASLATWPNSPHNQMPSCAIDFIPYPFRGWKDISGFILIAKELVKCSEELKISGRSGGDWNKDGNYYNEHFFDVGHFELHPWRKYLKAKKDV